jgi:hypothetical protein
MAPELSLAVIVTGKVPAVVGVPLTLPSEASMDKPGGRSATVQDVMVAVSEETVALEVRVPITVPARPNWLPGSTTDTVSVLGGLAIVQAKVAEPL